MKSYTAISQSKKLAEILPLESADMEYLSIKENGLLIGDIPFVKDDSEVEDSVYSHIYDRIACWSLAALLGVLPMIRKCEDTANPFIAKTPDGEYYIVYATLTKEVYNSSMYDNAVDACYEMIIKLKENNLL